jgi:hypothetical protein
MPGSVSGRRSPAGQRQCARSLASIRETPCRQGQRRSARQRPGAETENSCSGLAETGLRPNRLMVTCCRQARNDPTDARRIIAAFAASRAVGQRRVFGPRGGRRTAPRRRGNRHVPAKPEARSVSGLLRKGPAHHGSALTGIVLVRKPCPSPTSANRVTISFLGTVRFSGSRWQFPSSASHAHFDHDLAEIMRLAD